MSNTGWLLLFISAILGPWPQTAVRTGTPPFEGRLYAVVSSWTPAERLTRNDAARVTPSLRPRFERFMRCQATFRSRLPDTNEFFRKAALPHQRVLERALACLIEAPRIAELSADYATHARILYEWEGLSSSPLEEASYAEAWTAGHRDSPLVPYLYLFVAERARYAFELLDGEKDLMGMTAVAAQYRAFIDRARSADPMVALLANDLDGLTFVYRNVGKHPRDY